MKIDFTSDSRYFTVSKTDTYGGITVNFYPGYEMMELMKWWSEWQEVMQNNNAAVQDAIKQVKVLHELSKEEKSKIPAIGL